METLYALIAVPFPPLPSFVPGVQYFKGRTNEINRDSSYVQLLHESNASFIGRHEVVHMRFIYHYFRSGVALDWSRDLFKCSTS